MIQGSQTAQDLCFRHSDFFFLLFHGYSACERNAKELTPKKVSFQPKVEGAEQHSCYGARPPFWARLTSGFCLPLVSWKYFVLSGGSFSFEDWCLEEESGKPPAIWFSLCSRQDHPEVCLEKYYTSFWACSSDTSPDCAVKLMAGQLKIGKRVCLDRVTRIR